MDWMSTGEELVEKVGGRDAVERAIGELNWQEIPKNGKVTVGFLPGAGINECIRELRIPKVSSVAISAIEVPPATGDEDGFYPGFYGIEGNYSNGRARIYVLDVGTFLQPVCSELFEGERAASAV